MPSTETQTGGLFKAGSFPQWPKAWPLPSPNNGPHPIESEAINATDQNYSEHKNARNDWVNPGKNHKTTNNWND